MNTQVEYNILCYCFSDLKPSMIRIPVFGDTVDDTILSRHLQKILGKIGDIGFYKTSHKNSTSHSLIINFSDSECVLHPDPRFSFHSSGVL